MQHVIQIRKHVLNHVTTSQLAQVVAINLGSILMRTITSKYPEVHPPWDKLLLGGS